MHSGDGAIACGHHFAVDIASYPAYTVLLVGKNAVMRAQQTSDPSVRHFTGERGMMEGFTHSFMQSEIGKALGSCLNLGTVRILLYAYKHKRSRDNHGIFKPIAIAYPSS